MEPLGKVLESADFVTKSAQDVSIPENGIENLAKIVRSLYKSMSPSHCAHIRSITFSLILANYIKTGPREFE